MGQLAQPNQDSKRAAFFNNLKNKVGHIMAQASALRVNLNLLLSVPSFPSLPARNAHAHQIYALNILLIGIRTLLLNVLDLCHHILPLPSWLVSARSALYRRFLPSLLVAFAYLFLSSRPSPLVINIIIARRRL